MTDQPDPESADEGHPEPPTEEEQNATLPVRLDPCQPAYDAVYEYIRSLGPYLPPGPVHRNAIIWRAVHEALAATHLGRCVSSHCVEGDHMVFAEAEPGRSDTTRPACGCGEPADSPLQDQIAAAIGPVLAEHPEHDRTDEHQHVVNEVANAVLAVVGPIFDRFKQTNSDLARACLGLPAPEPAESGPTA